MKRDHLPRSGADQLPAGAPAPAEFPKTELGRAMTTWLADGRAQGWSPRTLDSRRSILRYLLWWLEHEGHETASLRVISTSLLRAFLAYAREPRPGGRYGNDHRMAAKAAKPSTVQTHHRNLRAFFNFCVAEGLLEGSPPRNVKPPRLPVEQVQPFIQEQVQALLTAAQSTEEKERNRAVLLVLVDSGLRISELCSLRVGDVDRTTGQASVTGKGNKRGAVYTGLTTRRALCRYLHVRRPGAEADEPLFHADGYLDGSRGMTPNAVRLLLRRLGKAAGVQGVRVSPHTARHSFAVSFLRAGGNLFELQALMGHGDLTTLRRYVALAETDLAKAHRISSPAHRMRLR